MRKTFTISMMMLSLFLTTNTAFALRCGNDLISIGDLKNEVLVKCGEPFSREIIGYIDRVESEYTDGVKSEKRVRVMKIEEWILEITNYGTIYYHSLVFEGNKLIEIKPAGQKKVK
ncbi:MAG: DUF2845 domain-containing protein [Deltaproteobacteria bacterium]|nr:DUF2845 domain-containing protein [Deltaproteobacteria bacterium]